MPTRIIVSLLYLGLLILLASRARKQTHNIEDYYVGGRRVATLLVVLSFYATFVSTNSFVGHSAKSYLYGVSWLLVGLLLVLLTLLSWTFIAPRFRERAQELGSIVPSDFFHLHFRSKAAGAIAAAIILFDSIFFLAAVFLGAAESMAGLLGIPFVLALSIVFVVQITYTTVGGYLADVWSDSLQAFVLFLGAVAMPVALVIGAGGWDHVVTELRVIDELNVSQHGFSLLRVTAAAPLLLIIGVGLSGGLKLVADPRQLSRFYALKDASSARRGVWLIGIAVAATYLFLLPIGLLARVYDLPPEIAARTDRIVPWLLADVEVIGPTLGAVVLTALLAAAMSTIDSVLLVAGAALQRDILPLLGWKKRADAVATARKIVVVYSLLPLGLAAVARFHPAARLDIVELTVFAGALYAGAFLPGLIGILYWKRSTAKGAIAGMLLGMISTTVWRFWITTTDPRLADFPEVFVGLGFGIAGFVIGSLAYTGRRGDPDLERD